jgi:hypothetical protein
MQTLFAFRKFPVEFTQRHRLLVNLGNFVATHKYARNSSSLVVHGFIHEVDELNRVAAVQSEFHASGDDRLAGRIDAVEQLEITLAGKLRKDVPHFAADEVFSSGDFDVCLVDV